VRVILFCLYGILLFILVMFRVFVLFAEVFFLSESIRCSKMAGFVLWMFDAV